MRAMRAGVWLAALCAWGACAQPNADLSAGAADRREVFIDPAKADLHSHSSPNPLNPTNLFFLNTVSNAQQPGVAQDHAQFGFLLNQSPRITFQHLREIDWTQVDRRAEEGESTGMDCR